MAGLKGQQRQPRLPARVRRNFDSLSTESPFVSISSGIELTDTGILRLRFASGAPFDQSSGLDLSLQTSGGLAVTGGELEVDEANVDHDSLQNFVSNEHVDHSAVSITAGTGLSGGGDITASRSLSADEANIDHDALQNFAANEHVDHSSVSILTSDPLTGGGDLTADRTLGLSSDATLAVSAGALGVVTTALDPATTTSVGVVEKATARADSAQTAVTLSGATDPADSPADADALRDDLVTNTIPSLTTRDSELETAVETLAGEFNDLLTKLRNAGILNV